MNIKKIPVCKQARELLDITEPIKYLHRTNVLNRILKRIMEDEEITQYYLRHTFVNVCQQYVRPDIVDIWMSDSSERLAGRIYTHFPDEFMIQQIQKSFSTFNFFSFHHAKKRANPSPKRESHKINYSFIDKNKAVYRTIFR